MGGIGPLIVYHVTTAGSNRVKKGGFAYTRPKKLGEPMSPLIPQVPPAGHAALGFAFKTDIHR